MTVKVALDHGNSTYLVSFRDDDAQAKLLKSGADDVRHKSIVWIVDDDESPLRFSDQGIDKSARGVGKIPCLKMYVGRRLQDVPENIRKLLVNVDAEQDEDDGIDQVVFTHGDRKFPVRTILEKFFRHVLSMVSHQLEDEDAAKKWVFGIAVPFECSQCTQNVYREVLRSVRPQCDVKFIKEMFAAHLYASREVNDAVLSDACSRFAVGIDIGNATAHAAAFKHERNQQGTCVVTALCTQSSYDCSGSAYTRALASFLANHVNLKSSEFLFRDMDVVAGYKEAIMDAYRIDSQKTKLSWASAMPAHFRQLAPQKKYLHVERDALDAIFEVPNQYLLAMLDALKASILQTDPDLDPASLNLVLTGGGVLGHRVRANCKSAFPASANNVTYDEVCAVVKGTMMFLDDTETDTPLPPPVAATADAAHAAHAPAPVPAPAPPRVELDVNIATQHLCLVMEHSKMSNVNIVVPLVRKGQRLPIVEQRVTGWNFRLPDSMEEEQDEDGTSYRTFQQQVIEGVFDLRTTGPAIEMQSLPQGRFSSYIIDIRMPEGAGVNDSFQLVYSLNTQFLELIFQVNRNKRRGSLLQARVKARRNTNTNCAT